MQKPLLKIVLGLILSFLPTYFFAQVIAIEAFEENTKKQIEFISITAFSKGKQTTVADKLPYADFAAYDSLLVQAFGYKGAWIHDFEIPATLSKDKIVPLGVLLVPLQIEINEIIISAGKFEEKKKDVARQIDVIKQKDIEFLSPSSTADILQNSGTVMVQKSQLGGGSPIIRGFEANKVQIVVDGVRLNNAIYRGGHLQNVLRIDNNALEKVEVIHGTGSVIYGSDALGGVMHFVTKKPEYNNSDTAKLLFRVGANSRYASAANELTGSFNFNFGWKKVALLTNFSYSEYGNLRQGASRVTADRDVWKRNYSNTRINNKDTMLLNTNSLSQTNSGYTQLDVLQKIVIKQNADIEHGINFQYSTTGDVPRYDRLNQTDSAQNAKTTAGRFFGENPTTNPYRYAEWYYGPEQRLLLSYTLATNNSPRKLMDGSMVVSSSKITVAYQDINESRHTRRFKNNNRQDREENVKVASLNADFQTLKKRNEIRYGAEWIYNEVKSTAQQININTGTKTAITTRYPEGGSDMFYGAVYATLNRELRKGFVLNAGARYNIVTLDAKFTDTALTKFPFTTARQSNTSLNGNLGVVYTHPKGWRVSGLLSSGFRVPNVDDLGKVFDSNPNDSIVIVPNPNLKPELTYSAEMSISKLLGTKGMIEAIGWYTLYKQAIITQAYILNGADKVVYDGVPSRVFANQNAGNNAYLYGGQLSLKYKVYKNITLSGAINYTYGRVETDSTPAPLAHILPVYGRVGLLWQNENLQLEVFSLFSAQKKVEDFDIVGEDNYYDATQNGMPAWYTLNIKGAYKLSEHSALQIGIENILDQNYRVFSSGISAPGRNVVVTLRAWL